MSGILISGQKISRAISGATTVAANGMAIVTYTGGSAGGGGGLTSTGTGAFTGLLAVGVIAPITRYFGPGASIPATFTSPGYISEQASGPVSVNITWTLASGVEFINS